MTIRYPSSFKIKTQDTMTPILKFVCLDIDSQLFDSPYELKSEVSQWIKFTESNSCLRKLGENVILNLNWTGNWIEIRITNLSIMQSEESEEEHIF